MLNFKPNRLIYYVDFNFLKWRDPDGPSHVFFWNQITKTHIWSPCKLIIPVKASWYRNQQRCEIYGWTHELAWPCAGNQFENIYRYGHTAELATQYKCTPRFLEALRNQITHDVRVSPECSSFLLISSVGSFYSVTGCVLVSGPLTDAALHTAHCCPVQQSHEHDDLAIWTGWS